MSIQPVGQRVVKDRHGAGSKVTFGTVAWVVAVVTFGVMVPWAVAVSRGKRNSTAIFFVNLLTFWTVVGWVVALVMALSPHQRLVVTDYAEVPVPVVPAAVAAPAGWYVQADGSQRWWDGSAWSEQQRP